MTTSRPSEPADRPGRALPTNGWGPPSERPGDAPWWGQVDQEARPAIGSPPTHGPDNRSGPATSAFAVPDQRQHLPRPPTVPPWATPPPFDRPGPPPHPWAETPRPPQPPYRPGADRPGGPWTGAQDARPSPPRTIVLSFWLLIVAMVVGVVGGVVSAVHTAQVERQIAEQLATVSDLPVPAVVGPSMATTIVAAVVMALFGAAVAVTLASLARAGRPWARIVLTVLTGVGLAFAGYRLFSSSGLAALAGPLTTVLLVVQASIVVAAVVLLYLPDSNAWFRGAGGR